MAGRVYKAWQREGVGGVVGVLGGVEEGGESRD